jgi:4-hydroxybenzoate polyprenyltransferase
MKNFNKVLISFVFVLLFIVGAVIFINNNILFFIFLGLAIISFLFIRYYANKDIKEAQRRHEEAMEKILGDLNNYTKKNKRS